MPEDGDDDPVAEDDLPHPNDDPLPPDITMDNEDLKIPRQRYLRWFTLALVNWRSHYSISNASTDAILRIFRQYIELNGLVDRVPLPKHMKHALATIGLSQSQDHNYFRSWIRCDHCSTIFHNPEHGINTYHHIIICIA